MDIPTFNNTVVYCAALVVRTHGQPTIAKTILDESSVLDNPEELRKCSEFDLEPLRKAGLIPANITGQE